MKAVTQDRYGTAEVDGVARTRHQQRRATARVATTRYPITAVICGGLR